MVNISEQMAICNPPYNESEQGVIAMYSAVLVIGLPANILTTVLTLIQIRRKNVLAVFLFSLSLSELMYLGTLPLWILYVKNGHKWIWGPMACKFTGYIFFNNIYISIFLLCCISIDRFLAVEYSLESRGVRRQRVAIITTFVLCMLVALTHSTTFFISDGDPEKGQATCFETLPMAPLIANFYYARFVIGFLIPLLILIYTNYTIKQRIEASSSFTEHQKTKVKCLAVTIIIIFMICFAPYHIVLLLRAIVHSLNPTDSCGFEEKVYTTYSALLCLLTMNSVADPFIYVLVSENVRKDLYRAVRSWRGTLSVNTRSDKSLQPNIPNSREQQVEKETSSQITHLS
ncbi:probable G-protein coupled receptor 132 [Spea bombifrons]|uniref:probable G-protein coupled receptor 132 n=1 Tax=Spea bombifrons TaxID=233779 RepID=UPI0023499B38|nr:probable G-protein coupled receptor 132 [Spea bombifrons]